MQRISEISKILSQDRVTFQPMLSSGLRNITNQLSRNTMKVFTSVLGNATEFVSFITNGDFSEQVLSQQEISAYMTTSFLTYITSLALSKLNIFAVIGTDIDVSAVAKNTTNLAYPLDCTNGYDANNVCDAWWYSTAQNSSIGLINADSPSTNYGPVLSQLFAANITTGETLLDASAFCNIVKDQPKTNVTLSVDGINTACITKIYTRTWDSSCHKTPTAETETDDKCEFLEAAKMPGFWDISEKTKGARMVPAAYLGPALVQKDVPITREG